jgi:isopenicillin-N N-acyltransferase-like protein
VIRHFRSTATEAEARGREFGTHHAAEIRRSLARYDALFERVAGSPVDVGAFGVAALDRIIGFSPALGAELIGLAAGAGVDATRIAALNARTEILATLRARTRGECSTVVHVDSYSGRPLALQTWDWYAEFADQWFVWEIPHADGRCVTTVTEFGILGKAGVTNRGLGLLFNILHHALDGGPMGVPVHILARAILDGSGDVNAALQLAHSTPVSASSCMTLVAAEDGASVAVAVEVHPGGPALVFPDAGGFLVHTNHFLAAAARPHDLEPAMFPDTEIRHDLLVRRLRDRPATRATALAAMNSHLGGIAAVCCHPDPGQPRTGQYETLATIVLDVGAGTLEALPGGPCRHVAAMPSLST